MRACTRTHPHTGLSTVWASAPAQAPPRSAATAPIASHSARLPAGPVLHTFQRLIMPVPCSTPQWPPTEPLKKVIPVAWHSRPFLTWPQQSFPGVSFRAPGAPTHPPANCPLPSPGAHAPAPPPWVFSFRVLCRGCLSPRLCQIPPRLQSPAQVSPPPQNCPHF